MKRFGLAIALLLLLLPPLVTALAKTEFFKIEDLRPGMKGIGKTCYQGTKPEEFQVEILGVLHGVSPGASAVLARFSGSQLDKTGIFEGMSGSPVFINGKLLGAVAYSYTFAKEPIGGITPITQMISSFEELLAPTKGVKLSFKKSGLWNYGLPLQSMPDKPMEFPILASDIHRQPHLAAFRGHSLIPIATPLGLGGIHSDTLKVFEPQFRAMGMSTQQGVGAVTPDVSTPQIGETESLPLEPGSNLIVSLVRGDLDVSAGGTVTYLDGNRLYAFGHNLLELGSTELPMHKARAIAVFPSLESSFKILEMSELAGTIRQDRGMGIYGIVGEKPTMIPLQIHLTTSRGAKRELRYELARDSFLTPLLVNLTVYNTIISSERAQGSVTLKVKGKISIKGEQAVEVDNRFSSDSDAPYSASLSVAVPINYLMAAGYKNLDLQSIDLEISSQEKDQAAFLDSIRLGGTEVRAGESLDLEVSCKKVNGEVVQDTYPVKIPGNISAGSLIVLVADGATLMSMDEKEELENVIPRDLTQLIRLINNLRKNDRLYVRLIRQELGAVVKGEGLPGLPPSILSILNSDRKAGVVNPIYASTLMEYELPPTDHMVTGARTLKITVKP